MEQPNKSKKKSVYNKERYEQNKEEILKYRREIYIYIIIIMLLLLLLLLLFIIILESKKKR